MSYGHDGIGRRTTLTWPDNFSIKYDYNVNNPPSEYLRKITESNGTLLAQFDYYDNGRRKSLTRGNGVVTSYNYNNLYQLKTQSTGVGGSSTSDDIAETFTYTQSGQLKTHLLNVANANYKYTPGVAAATNYVPDALNRIASVNGTSFTYDGRGNLTQDNTATTYTYNANNLLLNATKGGVATTLSYDAENRLYSVIKSGATKKIMYDGTDLIAETNTSNGILRRYVHGPETDDPIVWYEGSGTTDKRYYTANRQGSIVGVTLQNGLSTSVNAYDEYGIQKLSTIGSFQYTGQTWIPEVGLYYYKARFYNPNLGRFMQTDPIGYKDGVNWYAYVGNDLVNMVDPTGKFAVLLLFAPEIILAAKATLFVGSAVTVAAVASDAIDTGGESNGSTSPTGKPAPVDGATWSNTTGRKGTDIWDKLGSVEDAVGDAEGKSESSLTDRGNGVWTGTDANGNEIVVRPGGVEYTGGKGKGERANATVEIKPPRVEGEKPPPPTDKIRYQ